MRIAVLIVMLASAGAFAIPAKGSVLKIKLRSGAVVMGEVLAEAADGYLMRNGQKTQMVKFVDIADLEELAATPAAPAVPAAPAAPPAPPPVDPNKPCEPKCRDGFVCRAGQCVSACNPVCGYGYECRGTTCFDVEGERKAAEEKAEREAAAAQAKAEREAALAEERAQVAQLAAVANDSKGFHVGAQVSAEGGSGTVSHYSGLRAAVTGNLRIGSFDVRPSLGALAEVQASEPTFGGGTFDLEVRMLLTGRFAIGLGGRVGLVAPTVKLNCRGPGCPAVPVVETVRTVIFGAKVEPVVLRLGSGRNLELVLFGSVNALARGGLYGGGGLQVDYLFY